MSGHGKHSTVFAKGLSASGRSKPHPAGSRRDRRRRVLMDDQWARAIPRPKRDRPSPTASSFVNCVGSELAEILLVHGRLEFSSNSKRMSYSHTSRPSAIVSSIVSPGSRTWLPNTSSSHSSTDRRRVETNERRACIVLQGKGQVLGLSRR